MGHFLGIRLDAALAAALDDHARERGLNRSEAARDLMRRALGVSADESGFREGMNRVKRAAHSAVAEAIRTIDED